MINKIKEIGRALDAQCYHCALALALTLPDICGRVAYPNMSSLEQRKERYEKWFDTYVATQYFCSSNLNLPQNKNVLINGYACYLLRCAYLHCGNFDLLSQNNEIHIKKFRLHIDKLSGKMETLHLFHIVLYMSTVKIWSWILMFIIFVMLSDRPL